MGCTTNWGAGGWQYLNFAASGFDKSAFKRPSLDW